MRVLCRWLLCLLPAWAYAQTPPFELAAARGPHAVGARVVYHRDPSRPFRGASRPVQTIVWYPATQAGRTIRWGEYTLLDLTDTIARSLTASDSLQFRQRGIYRRFLADSNLIATNIDRSGIAAWNVPAQPGRYPVVLYAASFGASVWENAAFGEYMASHGWIVVAVPSVGARSRNMTPDAEGLLAQVGDIRLVHDWVMKQSWWNGKQMGLVGFSWGGTSGPIAALDGTLLFGAVVSWDGSIRYYPRIVDATVGLDSTAIFALRVPYLYLSSRRDHEPGTTPPPGQPVPNFDIWYRLPSSTPKTFIRWDKLEHGDFSMNHLLFESHGYPDATPVTERHLQYGQICRLTRAFLDQHIRKQGPGIRLTPQDIQRWKLYVFASPNP